MNRGLTSLGSVGAVLAIAVGGVAVVAPAALAEEPTTTFTIKVKGPQANRMTVTPYSVQQSEQFTAPYTDWKGETQAVENGRVTFTIPTAYTNGMSLQVTAPWEKQGGYYVPMVAMNKDGSYCYRGTKKAKKTLNLRVTKQRVKAMGEIAVIPNAYVRKAGKPSEPPGHQDLPYCVVPR